MCPNLGCPHWRVRAILRGRCRRRTLVVRQAYAAFAERGERGYPFVAEVAVIYSIPEWPGS